MNDTDNRQIARDSLLILAELRPEGEDTVYRVKVRNLSAGGMMAEGNLRVSRGGGVQVNLRNAGWVDGTVAWVQDNRFGIAFREEIDPKAVRANTASPPAPEAMVVKRRWVATPPSSRSARKII